MKTVCCLLITCLPALSHAAALSCQGSWRWLAMPGTEQLQDSGDQTATAGCRWRSELSPEGSMLFPAYPSLAYERALPTEYSRSEGYIRYEYWQLSVPVLRLGQVFTHVDILSDYRQQQHELKDALSWQSTTLAAGTQLILDSSERSYRLTFDLQRLESPISYVWLTYRQQWQPLSIRIDGTDVLANTRMSSRLLALGRQASGYGIQPEFSLAIGDGDIHNDGDTAELDAAGDQLHFQLIETRAGIKARYRLARRLTAHARAGLRWRYFMLPGGDDTDSIVKDSFSSLDYSASAGISWRF